MTDLRDLSPEVTAELLAVVVHRDGSTAVHTLGVVKGSSYHEFADNFNQLLKEMVDIWPSIVRAQRESHE